MQFVADLHCHSVHSDGVDSPADIVRHASDIGLKAISLTDHDTVGGLIEAELAATELEITFIPGVELSVEHSGRELHLLGYDFDPVSPAMMETCRSQQNWRRARYVALREWFVSKGLLPPELPTLKTDSPGRGHLATELVARGIAQDVPEAFARYLAPFAKQELPPLSIKTAIEILHAARGVAILAHPAASGASAIIRELWEVGLDGVEVWHPAHNQYDQGNLSALADQLGMFKTGGSDCHGLFDGMAGSLGSSGLTKQAWDKFARRVRVI